jgi:hypothetical protein
VEMSDRALVTVSTQMTFAPSASRRSERCEPGKPALPVYVVRGASRS